MGAAGILTGHIEALHRGAGVGVDHHAAHEIVGRGHHFDETGGQVEAAIGTALDHAFELLAHFVGTEMRHRNINAAILSCVALAQFVIDAAADHIAGGTLALWIIVKHEAVLSAVQQVTASATQAFFQDGAGHLGVIAGE